MKQTLKQKVIEIMATEEFLKDVCPNHTDTSKWNKSELLHILELHTEQLNKHAVIFWNKFEDVKPTPGEEYLVTNSDGVIRVSYYDGVNWGYLCSVKENIIYWIILPKSPL